jgi:hypothetical protein
MLGKSFNRKLRAKIEKPGASTLLHAFNIEFIVIIILLLSYFI